MAEEPTNVGDEAGSPPADAVEGAVVAPAAAPVEPSERPILPGQEIVYTGEDGKEAAVKVEDAVEAHKKLQAGGQVDSNDLKEFQLWMGAKTGDPDKVAEYAETLIPKKIPKPEVVAGEQQKTIDALQADLEEVKKVLAGEVQPVTNQLRAVTDLQAIAAEVKSRVGDHPHLARLAEKRGPMVAAQAIRERRGVYEQAARQEGRTLATLPSEVQGQILAKIFTDVETKLADIAAVYGEPLTKAPAPAPPAPVNDQGSPDAQPGYVAAKIQIGLDGRMLGEAPLQGTPGQGQPPVVPAVPVVPAPGGAPGIEPDRGQKPFTLDAMRETLKAEREKLAGVV